MTSPSSLSPNRAGSPALVQKLFNFSTLRGSKGAAETGAFQGCSGGGEPQRLPQPLIFGDRERKRAMEDVTRAERIHGVHREGRRLLQIAILVEPDRAAAAPRVPARNDEVSLEIFFSASPSSETSAVSCKGSLENTRCVDAVSSPSRSDIARSTSTITGMPRRQASAQRSVQNSAQRLSVRMAWQSSSSVSAGAAAPSIIPDRGM